MKNKRELRLVLTQRCNHNCTFCHKEGIHKTQKDKLNTGDFTYLFDLGKREFGFGSTTLTGGEPLVRDDIIDLAKSIKEKGGYVVLTTNGSLLKDKLDIGKYLNRINISFHTLNVNDYENISQVKGSFHKVLGGLFLFKSKYPNVELRLNATLVKGINTSKNKIREYIRFAEILGASIKFLELFPNTSKDFFPLEKVENILIELGFKKFSNENRKSDFRRRNMIIRLSKIFCAFAENTSDPCKFCKKYNDLFVTPEGKIKPCRSQLRSINILEDVKNRDDKKLTKKIQESLKILGDKCKYMEMEKCQM